MPHLIRLAAATAALAAATPALAADYLSYPELRPSYPDEWAMSEDNPLRFEVGLRYWYSLGSQDFDIGGLSQSADTTTHSGEAFFRIDDKSTNSFLDGMAGYSLAMEGDYTHTNSSFTPDLSESGTIYNGQLGYVGADFGYTPWGNESVQFGGLAGYLYWNDSPNTEGRYTTASTAAAIADPTSPDLARVENNLNIHALRLGVTGRIELADMIDLTAKAAAVPYAYVSGTMGNVSGDGTGSFAGSGAVLSSPMEFTGMGYGAMGQVMLGFKPTDHVAVSLGGRAWYLRGQTKATYSQATIDAGPPATLTSATVTDAENNPFEIFRYGLLAGVSVQF